MMVSAGGTSPGFSGTDQHVAREQRVPRQFGRDADTHLAGWLGADGKVLLEQGHAACVRHEVGGKQIELGDRHAAAGLPPDMVARRPVLDDVLVARRAAGMGAGGDHEGAACGHGAFATADRSLEQRRRRHVGRLRMRDRRALGKRGR